MNNLIIGAILLTIPLHVSGQKPASANTSGAHFYWSLRKAHELNYTRTIRNSPDLTLTDKSALIKAIAALKRPFMADREISSEKELRLVAANTRIELKDLNNDGIPEVIAQANGYGLPDKDVMKADCGATGNCAFWVFQKTSNGYKLLLDTRGPDGMGGMEMITVEQTRTDGFNDIVLAGHISADEKNLDVYRYINGRYQVRACYDASWEADAPDRHALKNPDIFPIPCN